MVDNSKNVIRAGLIKTLIQHLPRYAEEEGDFYPVPRAALVDALCQHQPLDRAVAENTVALIEALLDTFAVLNTDYLQKGEWCFVSFPAQLLALSLLTAWGDQDSRFFAANFWNTQGIANAKKEELRKVLHFVETTRDEHHASQAAKPIRYIYVAWGIIKIDGEILFYQREDTRKRHDKQAGDYGLIGGRLNQHDVPGNWDKRDLLTALQSENSALIKAALPETLKRELREEAGLNFGEHYHFKPWRCLKPYQQVQGSAPNHALTGYHLEIFQIDLTLEGYLLLQQQIKRDERLVWFTRDEMVKGETSDGKIAYLKALFDDFGNDRLALAKELAALPDSFTPRYVFQAQKYGLTLLVDAEKPVLAGVLGKEKPLDVVLTPKQSALLLGLAAHGRGFEFAAVVENIGFHPFGWVDVGNNPVLRVGLMELSSVFKGTDVIIENHQDELFRLSIDPSMVYFDETLFVFSVQDADLTSTQVRIPATLGRKAFVTAFGVVKPQTETFKIRLEFADKLRTIAGQRVVADNDEAVKTEDVCNKGLHKDPSFLAFGLRKLLRREDGFIKFCCQFDKLG